MDSGVDSGVPYSSRTRTPVSDSTTDSCGGYKLEGLLDGRKRFRSRWDSVISETPERPLRDLSLTRRSLSFSPNFCV